MPRERLPLSRASGIKNPEKFFVLAFEGERTEPIYFEALRASTHFLDNGKIETIHLPKSSKPSSHPLDVKKLLRQAKEDYNIRKNDECWMVIDTDDWESIHKVDFSKLADECHREGLFLAVSNPRFELWLLLHLTSLDELSEKELENIRSKKKIKYTDSDGKQQKQPQLEITIGELTGIPCGKHIEASLFIDEIDKIREAIGRAKELAVAEEPYPSDLGTHVYQLVEKLIKVD